jgi:hypothetical protein
MTYLQGNMPLSVYHSLAERRGFVCNYVWAFNLLPLFRAER